MKNENEKRMCEKCGKNEAACFYTCSINGKTESRALCLDCAREEGLLSGFDNGPADLFRGWNSGFFDDFFAPERSLLSAFDNLLSPFPAISVGSRGDCGCGERCGEHTEQGRRNPNAEPSRDTDGSLNRKREIAALKHRLKAAVRDENYEEAIRLRDQIRSLEA